MTVQIFKLIANGKIMYRVRQKEFGNWEKLICNPHEKFIGWGHPKLIRKLRSGPLIFTLTVHSKYVQEAFISCLYLWLTSMSLTPMFQYFMCLCNPNVIMHINMFRLEANS